MVIHVANFETEEGCIMGYESTFKPWGVTPHAAVFRSIDLSRNQPIVDLRPAIRRFGLSVRQQFGGTCAIFASTFLHEYIYSSRLVSDVRDLSEKYLQYVTFVLEKVQVQGGDNFGALNTGYQKWGVCPEQTVPGSSDPVSSVPQDVLDAGRKWAKLQPDFIKHWDKNNGASAEQIQRAIAYLDGDVPVAVGLLWPRDFQTNVIEGVDVMKVPAAGNKWDVVLDGHAVALVGYGKHKAFPGGGYFIFRNSWGEGFGDQGYGYIPFEYLTQYANDLLAFKPTGFTLVLGKLTAALWEHGNVVQCEAPERLKGSMYLGWGSEFSGRPSSTNWFHLPVTTPAVKDAARPVLGKVFVLYETTGSARITAVHLYDGKEEIRSFDGLGLAGAHRGAIDAANCFYVTPPVTVSYGLGVSVCVDFGTSADSSISFASAGADFHEA